MVSKLFYYMMNFLIEPLRFEFMQNALIIIILLGSLCAVTGSYLIVQKMALLGDVISHAVLSLVASLSQPILTIIPQQSPPYSQAEMEAIAQLPKITTVRLYGTLGISEEFGNEVAQEIKNFLS